MDNPAVISVNMQIASHAVNEFLNKIHSFKNGSPNEYAGSTIDITDGYIVNVPESDYPEDEYLMLKAGLGDVKPFYTNARIDFMKWYNKLKLKLRERHFPKNKIRFLLDYPEDLETNVFYLIGEPNDPWLLSFKCPCGCAKRIDLNLLIDTSPVWIISINRKGRLTIRPSIRRIDGCKSHFCVTQNRVEWCWPLIDQE